ICVVFFFQAEDGIRDSSVTGVQTCALPISDVSGAIARTPAMLPDGRILFTTLGHNGWELRAVAPLTSAQPLTAFVLPPFDSAPQIGRASCRARVQTWGECGWLDDERE